MRFRSFCIYIFLFLFSLFALGSGSGGVAPVLIFKSWKAGQGVKGGPRMPRKKRMCGIRFSRTQKRPVRYL